jgi:hypothetical protein
MSSKDKLDPQSSFCKGFCEVWLEGVKLSVHCLVANAKKILRSKQMNRLKERRR